MSNARRVSLPEGSVVTIRVLIEGRVHYSFSPLGKELVFSHDELLSLLDSQSDTLAIVAGEPREVLLEAIRLAHRHGVGESFAVCDISLSPD